MWHLVKQLPEVTELEQIAMECPADRLSGSLNRDAEPLASVACPIRILSPSLSPCCRRFLLEKEFKPVPLFLINLGLLLPEQSLPFPVLFPDQSFLPVGSLLALTLLPVGLLSEFVPIRNFGSTSGRETAFCSKNRRAGTWLLTTLATATQLCRSSWLNKLEILRLLAAQRIGIRQALVVYVPCALPRLGFLDNSCDTFRSECTYWQ